MITKRCLSFLLFLLTTTFLAAQTLPADELIRKAKCTDIGCFNTIMNNAGFQKPEVASIGNLNMFLYSSDKFFIADSIKNISRPNKCTFIVSKDKNYSAASLIVIPKSNYLSLTSAFTNLGFTKSKTYIKENSATTNDLATEYSSINYPDYVLTIHVINRQENSSAWTEYQFEVKRV